MKQRQCDLEQHFDPLKEEGVPHSQDRRPGKGSGRCVCVCVGGGGGGAETTIFIVA